eukprot:3829084-Rhodomonas_salina.2
MQSSRDPPALMAFPKQGPAAVVTITLLYSNAGHLLGDPLGGSSASTSPLAWSTRTTKPS